MNKAPQLRDFDKFQASAWALIAANLVPLFGVLFLGWDTFSIVVLYWFENVIIGVINVLKMLTCNPDPSQIDWSQLPNAERRDLAKLESTLTGAKGKVQLANHGMKLFLIPFFIFHYGLFCLVHGVFVFVLFGHDAFGHESFGFGPFGPLENIGEVFSQQHLWWGVVALAASHLWSFFVNYLGRGEYRRTAAIILMGQPYARVVVLHLAILLGAFISFGLGSNIGILTILVIGKTALDLTLHLREREKNASTEQHQPPILPDTITDRASAHPASPQAPEAK